MSDDPDDIQRKSFLLLPPADQMAVLFDMQRYIRGELVTIKKDFMEFEDEMRDVRKRREEREQKQENNMLDTTEKIAQALDKRFNFGVWMRDRVMPQVATLILLGILYLIFGGK